MAAVNAMAEAQRLAEERAQNRLHGRLEQGQEQRAVFNSLNNLNNPRSSFTTEELAIIDGPQPPYSVTERQEDEKYEDYTCPLSHAVPTPSEACRWQGRIYSFLALSEYREGFLDPDDTRAPTNPVTRQPISWVELTSGETFLTNDERRNLARLASSYNARSQRRDALTRYNTLTRRLTQLQTVARAQARARAAGMPVGRAEPIRDQVQNITETNPEALLADELEEPVPPEAPTDLANPLNDNQEQLRAVPTQFWGDPEFEVLVNNFLLMCEGQGWGTTLVRGVRTNYLRDNTASFFADEGPFHGYVSTFIIKYINY